MTQLSPHFTIEEMLHSETAARLGISNTPDAQQLANLYRVAETMEQVRSHLGKIILVSSGFRCEELNRKIGGVITSAHCKGLACDWRAMGMSNYSAAFSIRDSGIIFDQLILEYGWVHIGLCDAKQSPRMQCLTKRSASSPYENGINL